MEWLDQPSKKVERFDSPSKKVEKVDQRPRKVEKVYHPPKKMESDGELFQNMNTRVPNEPILLLNHEFEKLSIH